MYSLATSADRFGSLITSPIIIRKVSASPSRQHCIGRLLVALGVIIKYYRDISGFIQSLLVHVLISL